MATPPHLDANERASFSGKLVLALVPTRIVVMSPEKLVGSLAPAWGVGVAVPYPKQMTWCIFYFFWVILE